MFKQVFLKNAPHNLFMKFLTPIIALVAAISSLQAAIPIKSGEKVAFLGDSITQQGNNLAIGYVRLVASGLAANGVDIEVIGAGISGHKSDNMLARLEKDVLSKKPQWMTLSCGVNDVWHGKKGIELPDYKKNITEIVDQAQAAGIKVIILTSTMITENPSNPNNKTLDKYNDFLKTLAEEKNCLLADLNAEMKTALTEAKKAKAKTIKGNYLTYDGVHMALPGNLMMARGVLKGMGLDAAELNRAEEAWLDTPDLIEISAKMGLTKRQADYLQKIADERGISLHELATEEFQKAIKTLPKSR